MALKTILACLMNRETADAVLRCAVPLARAHDAHLIGLHTLEALLVYPGIAMHVPDGAFAGFNENQKVEAAAIETIFRRHTVNEDFVSEWRLTKTEATSAADRIVESAFAADIVIMPKEEGSAVRGDQHHAQEHVIRKGGRPVIIIPPDFNGSLVGQKTVLGWSNTREAARAAHDLLAVAQPGSEISIVRVDGERDELTDFSIVDLATTYDRHGLHTKTLQQNKGPNSISDLLLKVAFEQGADLLATGAFGHSRAYDFVMGAVSYSLLRTARMPVLFSA